VVGVELSQSFYGAPRLLQQCFGLLQASLRCLFHLRSFVVTIQSPLLRRFLNAKTWINQEKTLKNRDFYTALENTHETPHIFPFLTTHY
jgi:hypothetical protein